MSWTTQPRKLADFGKLLPAEAKLLAELDTGQPCIIGRKVPPVEPPKDVVIRASFLRWCILRGPEAEETPKFRVHEKGVRLTGAYIRGDGPTPYSDDHTAGLDLEGCKIRGDLGLGFCRFPDLLLLRGASLSTLNLYGSHLMAGLDADGLQSTGAVFLRQVVVKGETRIRSARIGGQLNCDGGRFENPREYALNADGLQTTDNVFLRQVVVTGETRLPGARIGGNLDCIGGQFANSEKNALFADGLQTIDSVFLQQVDMIGTTRVVGATIGGDLDCSGGRFECTRGVAITVQWAKVTGTLFWRSEIHIDGVMDLNGATLGAINDDPQCWPKAGDLLLEGCTYGAFVGNNAPVDARQRLKWLALQGPKRWGVDFWPQPYEQLAKVLREAGHETDARTVLIEKERLQREVRREQRRRERLYEDAYALTVWDAILGTTVRYGRQPFLAFAWLLGFWLLGLIVFQAAQNQGALKPNNAFVLRAPEWVGCAGTQTHPTQYDCFRAQPQAVSYPEFNAAIYSLDTLLPIVALEMQEFWIPDEDHPFGYWARIYLWAQIGVGWALSLLAVAGFSGLIRSDSGK